VEVVSVFGLTVDENSWFFVYWPKWVKKKIVGELNQIKKKCCGIEK
jgi:hypothetical protein